VAKPLKTSAELTALLNGELRKHQVCAGIVWTGLRLWLMTGWTTLGQPAFSADQPLQSQVSASAFSWQP
jgi:DUF1365 family protein